MSNTKSNTNQHGNCELKEEKVIKALELCISGIKCSECDYSEKGCRQVFKDSLDLINRRNGQIQSLKADKEALINGQGSLQKYIAEKMAVIERLKTGLKVVTDELTSQIIRSKSEARKELAERLKKEVSHIPAWGRVAEKKIDKLVKEMTESEC